MSTNLYIELCTAVRNGDVRAELVEGSSGHSAKHDLNAKIRELEEIVQDATVKNERLQDELQDSKAREADLRIQNGRLRKLLLLYANKTDSFSQSLVQADFQIRRVLNAMGAIKKSTGDLRSVETCIDKNDP